ncbi:MAG: hypothetical protein ABGX71_11465 [Methyloprofundus sp.]|uniref:hypothetical protein n=1 Tax=Methyloprofundus sp. TaxID=2020875 RepID=UPI001A142C89|nr:hypothetical protein [Methyloprofundus sp.]HIL77717.1 hypothetical protein [Methylococcales bacterium]
MSFRTSIVKIAIKLTPNKLITWIANIILKDIAELTAFNLDLDARTSFVQIQLVGESETIDVWLEGFAIISDETSHHFFVEHAKSNRIWLDNILSRIVRKKWKIPVPAEMSSHIGFLAELLKAEGTDQENN